MRKKRFLVAAVLFIFLSALAASAQQTNSSSRLNLSISAASQTFFVNSGVASGWMVNVKITNHSKESVNLKDFYGIHFIFAKTNSDTQILGVYRFNEQKLKPQESFEFETDLSKLSWLERVEANFSSTDKSEKHIPFQPDFQSGVYALSAVVSNCEEVALDKNESRFEVRNCQSNSLAVKVSSEKRE